MNEGSASSDRTRPTKYWGGQVCPRLRHILWHWHLGTALTAPVPLIWMCSATTVGQLPVDEIASAVLAFASLSFGACVTGAVLALTLPSEGQVKQMARTKSARDRGFSTYSNLIFAFTWSAISQLGLVMTVALMYLLGGKVSVWPSDPRLTHVALLYGALAVGTYSIIRLFSVITTISQIAVVIIEGIASAPDQATASRDGDRQ